MSALMPEARMTVVDRMKERLATFAPASLDIIDDSARHAGHEGAKSGGGHYRLAIVSERFNGVSRPARHRMVYDALGPMMQCEIHALSIQAVAANEV